MSTPTGEIRLIAPTGTLGYGFSVADFARALEEHRPHVIAVDAGSTDPGPYYLGSGESFTERVEIRRELEILIGAALEADIPLIVGTAGGSGARAHVAWTREIVEELAREHGWSFRLGLIQSEVSAGAVEQKLADGAIRDGGGDVYEFSVYHLMEVADPLELVEIEIHDIGQPGKVGQRPEKVATTL